MALDGNDRKEEYDDDPLSQKEIEDLRALLEHERRVKWFYSSARIWAGWLIGAPVAVLAAWQALAKILGFEK